VKLLHVKDDPSTSRSLVEEALVRCASLGAERGVPVDWALEEGVPDEVVAAHGQWAGCSLVVLGPRSKKDLGTWLLGSTAEKIVRRCRTPVLAVHGAPAGPYRRALACLDFEEASRQALRAAVALDLAPKHGFAAVHAFFSPMEAMIGMGGVPAQAVGAGGLGAGNEALLKAIAELKALGLDQFHVRTFIEEGEAVPVINAACGRWDPDLLVMGSHGRGPIAELFLGSTAASTLRSARCDVLVKRVE
jgi:CPA2 family monovalent cation:H+ antiporter-2